MSLKFQNLSFNPMQNSILERDKAFNSKEKVKLGFLCNLCTFLNVYVSWIKRDKILIPQVRGKLQKNKQKDGLCYNFNQLKITFFVFMFKMVSLKFSWYLQGIFLIGPIHQHKTRHVWDGFSLVCYLLIGKRYLRTTCDVPKLL